MKPDEILTRLKKAMRQSSQVKRDWEAVTPDMTIASLGFDSLTMLDLLYDVQQEFGIEIEAEKMTGVRTVGDLVGFLSEQARG